MLRECVLGCHCWVFFQVEIISLLLIFDDLLALLEHLNLSVKAVHVILVSKNHVLVLVSNFELKVFGAHR